MIIPSDGQTSSTEQLSCIMYGVGGFSGSASVDCSSSISGITCASSPSTVAISTSISTVIITVTAESSIQSGTGSIVVTGKSGSISTSATVPVEILAAGGAQIAVFDAAYHVPRCSVWGSECSSGNLLVGRGTITGGNELDAPNTIDSCQDGNAGTYGIDESIEKIVVRSGWVSGVGMNQAMVKGERATIIATVHAYFQGALA